jgi:outer membrane lipopolysaccharide assembly protein LptE/RlpB
VWRQIGNSLLFLAVVGACGYHAQVSLPDDLKRIRLEVSDTGSSRPGLQTDVTQALTQRILNAGGQVVHEKSQADATMTATITALENNAVAFDATDIARRFRVVVVVDLQVMQRKGKVELAREQVRGEAYYSAPSGVTGSEVAQNDAIRRAIRDLADQAVTRVVEPL